MSKTRFWLYVLLWIIVLNTCDTNYRIDSLEKTWDQKLVGPPND